MPEPEHLPMAARRLVLVAEQVQRAVRGEECHLARQRAPAPARLTLGLRRADDDVADLERSVAVAHRCVVDEDEGDRRVRREPERPDGGADRSAHGCEVARCGAANGEPQCPEASGGGGGAVGSRAMRSSGYGIRSGVLSSIDRTAASVLSASMTMPASLLRGFGPG